MYLRCIDKLLEHTILQVCHCCNDQRVKPHAKYFSDEHRFTQTFSRLEDYITITMTILHSLFENTRTFRVHLIQL